ncbi:hypothetical protein DYB35_010310 [Aphanomyces astaci]|uniref:Uncharacterized protein n=1 Tax=Aphanomyces astaci TaxID=112090 RepID=A0A418DFB1_APHAT|nr:hypothetical protein DYB35_010310 [Aphanomyces astaci]
MTDDQIRSISTTTRGISAKFLVQLRGASKPAHKGAYSPRLVDHKKNENPYESLFGPDWKSAVMASSGLKSSICVTELVEHIVHASAAVMHNTAHAEDWMFMHDALSQMTCKSTIQWMKEKNYHRRWILPELGLNDGTRFAGRPVGNSPELMPWDCSLNKDVDDCFHRHRSVTLGLSRDASAKFCASTPKRLESAYLRLIDPRHGPHKGCPTSNRIIQDVTKCLTTHILAVIAAGGAIVPGLGSRRVRGVERRGGRRDKAPDLQGRWYHDDAVVARAELLKTSIATTREHSDG